MSNSINTNIAAFYAQQNITTASNAATLNVAQLSSGNAIINASDNVAALAIGTSIGSQVSILQTAQTNASQGTSLLQVADGTLAQVQTILQQMQSVANQAQSGSLTNTDRGFLNQEFQSLSAQIDSLSQGTTFNGVQLLNGGISGNSGIGTNSGDNNVAAQANGGNLATFVNAAPVTGDTLTIDNYTVTFTTAAAGTAAAAGKVVIGNANSIADTAANLAAFLNNAQAPQLANLQFVASATGVSVVYTGGTLAGTLNLTASANFATPANLTTGNKTIAAGGSNGLGAGTYSASGATTGAILNTADSSTTNFGTAIDVSTLKNNATFSGAFNSVGTITGSFNGTAGNASFAIKVGNITYTTTDTTLTGATPTTLTFTGHDQNGVVAGGSFKLFLAGSSIAAVASQADATSIANQLNSGLSGVTVFQNRTVSSFQNGGVVSNAGVQVANLAGFSVNLHDSNYTNPVISSISIAAPGVGSTDAIVTAVINGETYQSVAGIGNQIAKNTVIGLQDLNDPTKTLSLVTGNAGIASNAATALDLSTQANADAVTAALKQAFGLNNANASLTFQLGSNSASNVGVSIASVTTSALFGSTPLDVATADDAAAAAAAVQKALDTVTAVRSGVGALETRFNFASAALQSSVQNETAAQSQLLDTNVANVSTQFATNQVKLQAGISVLAQANQQTQALLKLIG